MELGDQAELQQISRLDLAQDYRQCDARRGQSPCAEAMDEPRPRREMIFSEASEAPTAVMNRMFGRIDLQELLLRMLAATLRRHRSNRAFHYLQQRLLHALARDIPRDRWVVRTSG